MDIGIMDGISAIDLARAQFAFTMSFHIVFPAFSIGLASYLDVLEARWLWTGREVFIYLFNYWLKIFAIAFGMGVVSGIVMSYQFGTNWSVFADKTGPVLGPLMGYEVLSAFFLEAGFLGEMLFGLKRVGHRLHFFATLMVAVGTLFSAFWILSANSWMQTPAGYAINSVGQFVPADWWEVIFNPSFPYRLVHMVLAAYLTTALVVGGVGAWHLLRDSSRDGTPLILFGWPDQMIARVKYSVEVPKASSLILKHSLDAPLKGLDTVPRKDWPNVPLVFWSFRTMVGIGFLMLGLGLFSLWTRWRSTLYESRWLHRYALAMGPAGFIAVLAGWITTEAGRQPYLVWGLLRTADSASPLATPAVASSLIAFIIVYFAVFTVGIFYILRLMAEPPHHGEEGPSRDTPVRAAGITPGPAVAAQEHRP